MDIFDIIGFLWGFLLVDPMTNMLVALARVFGGNFGISIVIFTLIMKAVTWPLTASQYKTQKVMQSMQPKLQELQKKHKGKDPKKLQQETMALYKEAGFNPFGCLLPMLAQFPIWIALYQVIRTSVGETPESLVSLSQRLYSVPYLHEAVPLDTRFLLWNLGVRDTTLLLPVLVAVTMYVQQKMITPAQTTQATTQQQLQQQQTQQMMTWMMPLMFGYFSLNVPSGLALYWFVSNLSGLIIQYFYMGRRVNWRDMLRPFPSAAAPTPAARGGKVAQAQQRPQALKRPDEAGDGAEPSEAAGVAERPSGGGRSKRGRRHGRRRGKR